MRENIMLAAFAIWLATVSWATCTPAAPATAAGQEHPAMAFKLYQEGEQLRKQGRLKEAEVKYRQAATLWEKIFGPNHPSVAVALTGLADLCKEQRRYQEAEPLYQRTLRIWEQALGKDNPATGFGLRSLARFYEQVGRLAEAEPLCQRAAAIFAASLPQGHPDIAITQEECRQLALRTYNLNPHAQSLSFPRHEPPNWTHD